MDLDKRARLRQIFQTLKGKRQPGERNLTFRGFADFFKFSAGICVYCDREHPWSQLTLDHATPLSRGGAAFDWANWRLACKSCNAIKGLLTEAEFRALIGDRLAVFYEIFPEKGVGKPFWLKKRS